MDEGYDPEWVEFENAMGGRPNLPSTREEKFQAFNSLLTETSKQLPPTDPEIQTRDEQVYPDVPVRIYTPAKKPGTGRLPLVVFYHGGGWFAGNLDTEDHLCRVLCTGVHCVVVSVAYRLTPNVPFSTQIQDCYDGYLWAYNHADTLGTDPKRSIILGGSAGGSLAISTTWKLVNAGQPIAGLSVMGPSAVHPDAVPEKYQWLHQSYVENGGSIPIVTAKDALGAFDFCKLQPSDCKNVLYFPIAGGSEAVKGFPPTYIINMGKECMRDDGLVLKAELEDAGVPVKRDLMTGFPHYFWVLPVETGGKIYREKLIAGIKWVLETA